MDPRDCLHSSTHISSASAQKPTLIVPDKDADGLSAGVIMYRTLVKLGLGSKHLDVHLVQKGSNIHEEDERSLMLEKKPSYVIILDQGSRGGPPVIDDPDAKSLILDHHLSDDFPKDAQVCSKFSCGASAHSYRFSQPVIVHQSQQHPSLRTKSVRSSTPTSHQNAAIFVQLALTVILGTRSNGYPRSQTWERHSRNTRRS